MKRIVTDLWYGNLSPFERCEEGKDELKKLVVLMARNEEKLKEGLKENQKEILEKYRDAIEEYNSKIQENAFFEGVSFGIKIMTSIFSDNQ